MTAEWAQDSAPDPDSRKPSGTQIECVSGKPDPGLWTLDKLMKPKAQEKRALAEPGSRHWDR